MSESFPKVIDTRELRIAIDDGFNWIIVDYGEALEIAFLPLLKMLLAIEQVLLWMPWYAVLAAIYALTGLATRSWKVTGTVAACWRWSA
ncbi:MAG: hypothetical protein OXC14_14365 [Rhodospirillaceae bacterium]|nr:hypothetical protein [Rhodospirillaceae bacterium]